MPFEDPVIDATDLYHLVQDWYQLHPGAAIPLEAWTDKLEKYEIQKGDSIRIRTPEFSVDFENSVMIPVLAAISLDATTEQLVKVITHHGAKMHDLRFSLFSKADERKANDLLQVRGQRTPLDLYHVTNRMVQAMISDPKLLISFGHAIDNLAIPPTVQVSAAVLNNDFEPLWPISRIDKFFNDFEITREWKPIPSPTKIDVFTAGFKDTSDFSNIELLEMMRRSAVFDPKVCRDYGFEDSFLKSACVQALSYKESASRLIAAINSVEDPNQKREITNKIIAVFSEAEKFKDEGNHFVSCLFNLLDAKKFPNVTNSLVLRLNASPKSIFSVNEEYPSLKKIEHVTQEGLLAALSSELLAIPPRDMRWHHFRSLSRASSIKVNQKVEGSVLTQLIIHMAESHQRYTGELRITETERVKNNVADSIGKFLTYALKLAAPDYTKLSTLESGSRALLAIHGFDMKKLAPGMSNKDKGKVLCEGLGL